MSNHWAINWLVIENSLWSITNLWHWLLIDVACMASVSTSRKSKKKEQELDWKRLLWRLSLMSSMGNWCIRLLIDYLTIIYRFHWCHWCHRLDTSVGVTFNCYVPFPPRNFFTQTSILFILCGRPSISTLISSKTFNMDQDHEQRVFNCAFTEAVNEGLECVVW